MSRVDRFAAGPTEPEGQEIVEARILNAAAHRFAEQGFGRVNIGAVCARSGYSRAVIFQHFGDKNGLARRVVEWAVAEFTDAFSEAVAARTGGATATPIDLLRAFLDIMFELIRTMPPL